MRDISLHLLDLVQNSISAESKHVIIEICLSETGWLKLTISDDGYGMTPENQHNALNPFYTTRKTRKIGLGISLTAANAGLTGGKAEIQSAPGQGTIITATFNTRHIDCLPLGDITGSIVSLVMAHPDGPDFLVSCTSPNGKYCFSTSEARQILDGISLAEPEVISWLNETMQKEIMSLFGGIVV